MATFAATLQGVNGTERKLGRLDQIARLRRARRHSPPGSRHHQRPRRAGGLSSAKPFRNGSRLIASASAARPYSVQ